MSLVRGIRDVLANAFVLTDNDDEQPVRANHLPQPTKPELGYVGLLYDKLSGTILSIETGTLQQLTQRRIKLLEAEDGGQDLLLLKANATQQIRVGTTVNQMLAALEAEILRLR